jgi:cell division protein FtsI (penicillin-binding protein 3)
LMKTLVQNQAQYGTAIVMETKTGKIKALANLGRTKDTIYSEGLNYALQATEPGSTIKLATLLSVLDHGSSTVNDLVNVGSTGNAYVGVRNVTDDERSDKPLLTVRECFARSSNVGMSMVAYKAFANEPDVYKSYLHKFHLDRKTGIDLVGEGAPVLPKLKRNKEGLHAMVTASFGYAIQVTPLQTITLYNAIANDGKMVKPYLVNSIKSNGITVKEFSPSVIDEQIVKPQIVKAAKACMEAVVTEGTGKDVFKDFPFAVAGKTGTAHVADGVHGYGDGIYQATFVGYFPANAPEYTCIVVIKTKPHAAIHFGAQLSAPVFKEIATKLYAQYVQGKKTGPLQLAVDSSMYQYSGYTPDMRNVLAALDVKHVDSSYKSSWSWIYSNNYKPVVKAETVSKNVMPDVKSMTLKDALYLLENMNMKVVVKGRGKVVAQDVQVGSLINKNQIVTLLLN